MEIWGHRKKNFYECYYNFIKYLLTGIFLKVVRHIMKKLRTCYIISEENNQYS